MLHFVLHLIIFGYNIQPVWFQVTTCHWHMHFFT